MCLNRQNKEFRIELFMNLELKSVCLSVCVSVCAYVCARMPTNSFFAICDQFLSRKDPDNIKKFELLEFENLKY